MINELTLRITKDSPEHTLALAPLTIVTGSAAHQQVADALIRGYRAITVRFEPVQAPHRLAVQCEGKVWQVWPKDERSQGIEDAWAWRNALTAISGAGMEWTGEWEDSAIRTRLNALGEDPGVLIARHAEVGIDEPGRERYAERLIELARNGTQVIAETHSEVVQLAVRCQIREGRIPCSDVVFVHASEPDRPRIEVVRVTPEGRFANVPDRFFDTSERLLVRFLAPIPSGA